MTLTLDSSGTSYNAFLKRKLSSMFQFLMTTPIVSISNSSPESLKYKLIALRPMHLKLAPQQIQRAILQRCALAPGKDHCGLMVSLPIQSLVGAE